MVNQPDIGAGFAPQLVFHVDGLRRDPGEAAVLDPGRRAAFVGIFPWSLEVARSAIRLPPQMVQLASGPIVHRRDAEAWLGLLRPLLLHARGCPGFVLCTITRLEVSPTRAHLFGTCAPLMFHVLGPSCRGDVTRR